MECSWTTWWSSSKGARPETGAGVLEAIFEGAPELLSFGGRTEGDARAQVALWRVYICLFLFMASPSKDSASQVIIKREKRSRLE